MNIQHAQFANAENTSINATIEGKHWSNITAQNRFWPGVLEWAEIEGNSVTPFSRPPIGVAEVKAERQRRIYQIADNDKQAYYQRLMIAWLEQGKDNWTPEQVAQVVAIRAGNAVIDLTVAKAAELEAMEPIPADYQDDKWWS